MVNVSEARNKSFACGQSACYSCYSSTSTSDSHLAESKINTLAHMLSKFKNNTCAVSNYVLFIFNQPK